MAVFKKKMYNDLGLGSKASSGKYRSLNKDGTFNVEKLNVPFFDKINVFHSLITMSWSSFIIWVLVGYFIANLFFAGIYLLVGVEHLTGIIEESNFDKFVEAFFFSSQTITTLGYGRVAPIGLIANIVASVESLIGLLAIALATGMLFGRFSRPSGKIRYSSKAVLAPYQDINGFMFRVTNPQKNQLLEVEATVTISMQNETKEYRDFHLLELERKKVIFLTSVWTIVHPITKSSPLYQLSLEDFHKMDVEFIVILKAYDESSSQHVYSRSSYKASEIVAGQKFVYLMDHQNGNLAIDISRLSEMEPAALNIG